jgi:polysaccharide export outer membrane protein
MATGTMLRRLLQRRFRDGAARRGGLVPALLLCAGLWLVPGQAQAQYLGAAPQHGSAPPAGAAAGSDVVSALLAAQRPPVTLQPGDELQIEIFEIPKYQYRTRVNTDGTVGMPLVASISLEGLTAEQAEMAIAHRLQNDGMVNDPHVQVTVLEKPSQVITVAGDVMKPGIFPAFGNSTLLNVLSQASGFTLLASRTITLNRPGAAQPYALNLGSNPASSPVGLIPVFAGDTITVGSVGVFYVVGAVKLSGVYKLKTESPTTAVQAVTEAGGAGFEAQGTRAEIVRTIDGKRVEIPFDYAKALAHLGPDPVLIADDIVFLPTDKLRATIKGGGVGVAVALASAFFYRY